MRTFVVYRREAKSLKTEVDTDNYLEGDQIQFEGVEFSDGSAVIRWRTEWKSTSVWASMEDLKKVHIYSHPDYGTEIHWSDGEIEKL